MEKIILYHGTSDKIFTPTYGKGNDGERSPAIFHQHKEC